MEYSYSTFITTRNFTYSYVHITPADIQKPYILFLHGFPGSSYDWRHQIFSFEQMGYGIIAPDLLGYGGTSKPLDMKAYTGKGMAGDLMELLKSENILQLVGIAHDWGSFLLSRLANYFPDLFLKLAFLDVGYSTPGHGLTRETVEFVNKSVQEAMGFEIFGYFLFFDEEDAAELMGLNASLIWSFIFCSLLGEVDSLQSLMHSTNNELGKEYMGATGGMRKWLSEKRIAKREDWLEPEAIEHDRKLFARETGGYAAALNWYRAQLHDINAEDEKAIPEANCILNQPVLLITTDNFISATADMATQMKFSAPKLQVEEVEGSHWVMLQKKSEVSGILCRFVEH
ncbi:alpha/beta-hydrolase [Diplocarpon rosae]|nr:alpha/beta-hydrolase [Diplocarpon rosae]